MDRYTAARSESWCAWQGSSLLARFRGTAIRADFEGSEKPDFVRVIIDCNAADSTKLEISPQRQTYAFASGLAAGEHQIEIVKETYASEGHLIFHSFQISGGGLLDFDLGQHWHE
jgi:hypothetical protein